MRWKLWLARAAACAAVLAATGPPARAGFTTIQSNGAGLTKGQEDTIVEYNPAQHGVNDSSFALSGGKGKNTILFKLYGSADAMGNPLANSGLGFDYVRVNDSLDKLFSSSNGLVTAQAEAKFASRGSLFGYYAEHTTPFTATGPNSEAARFVPIVSVNPTGKEHFFGSATNPTVPHTVPIDAPSGSPFKFGLASGGLADGSGTPHFYYLSSDPADNIAGKDQLVTFRLLHDGSKTYTAIDGFGVTHTYTSSWKAGDLVLAWEDLRGNDPQSGTRTGNDFNDAVVQVHLTATPEPGTLALTGLAVSCFGAHGFWKRRRKAPQAA